MVKEENAVGLAILGMAFIVVIVGLAMMFNGNTGSVAIGTYQSGAICWDSGNTACTASLACEGGRGGIYLGATNSHYECICDEHLLAQTRAQYGSFRTTLDGSVYNPDHVKLIAKCRTY